MPRLATQMLDAVLDIPLPWKVSQLLTRYQIESLRHYYDQVIDETPPKETRQEQPHFEIHSLLGKKHVGMCLWAVKGLLHHANKKYSIVLHDDGSLGQDDIAKLERHLPKVKIFQKQEADNLIREQIKNYPLVSQYRFGELGSTDWGRRMSIFSLKLLDFNLLTNARKILVLDTDVLFFRRPDAIIQWVEDCELHETLYCHEYHTPVLNRNKKVTGFDRKKEAPVGFNSGLICLDRNAIDLSRFEIWLESNRTRVNTVYTFEQHAYNHLVDRNDQLHRPLADTYSFNYNDSDSVATHFGIKPLFFKNLERVRKALTQVTN